MREMIVVMFKKTLFFKLAMRKLWSGNFAPFSEEFAGAPLPALLPDFIGFCAGHLAISRIFRVETVLRLHPAQNTPLKRGVNEKNPVRMAMFVKHLG